MNRTTIYLFLCIVATVFSFSQFVLLLVEHGADTRLFVEQLFSTRIGAFVIVSAVVLWVFIAYEARGMRHAWLPVAATLLVGVSLGLPLFLYMREMQSETRAPAVREEASSPS